jgi:hypothetical protein
LSIITNQLKSRHGTGKAVEGSILEFQKKVADKKQPAQKLHDATIHAARQRPLDEVMSDMKLSESLPMPSLDRRIILGGQTALLKAYYIILSDRFPIIQALKSSELAGSVKISGGLPDQLAKSFFKACKTSIDQCNTDNLPKLAVETSIYFAKIARLFDSYCLATESDSGKNIDVIPDAKELLDRALQLCDQPFQNADLLRTAVEECINSLSKEWYEEVTPEEIAAIKAAMVSGRGGLATNSGHW